jgi:integrase
MPKSSVKTAPTQKPAKPYPDFPLFAHATRRWAKKIRGRFEFFGPWDDPQGALERYLDTRDDLHAGRTPKPYRDGLRMRDLANLYLAAKQRKVDAGELTLKSWSDAHRVCTRCIEVFGKNAVVEELRPDDFGRLRARMAETMGPVALGNEIGRIRSIFKFAVDAEHIEKPVRFGPEFVRPPQRALRKARNERGEKMFEPGEIKALLKHASVPVKAAILLGINCAFGQSDFAALPIKAIDLKKAMINFPRPKTEIPRRCPLWPETVKAVEKAMKERPKPASKEHAGLAFLTNRGVPWVRIGPPKKTEGRTTTQPTVWIDSLGNEFKKVCEAAGIDRKGRGFYSLRHTFRTVADELPDRPAIDLIMGHEPAGDMRTRYVERIGEERLKGVVGHVKQWMHQRSMRG